MSYTLYEQSRDLGAPIECYRFTGSFRKYFYTSGDAEILLGRDTYYPEIMSRGMIRVGASGDTDFNLEIRLDASSPLVKDYAWKPVPPQDLSVEVFRFHRDGDPATAFVKIWEGFVVSIDITDRMAKLLVPGSFSSIGRNELPNIYYQYSCNHVLYDQKCSVSRKAYTKQAVVDQVSEGAISISSSQFADGVLSAGEIICIRTKERRGIVMNTGTTIRIVFPFTDIVPGDKVELAAGCDHSFATCRDKFSNTKNYGGFPSIPKDNPFSGEIR